MMEIVGAAVGQFLQCISAPVTECWKYHRGIKENMVILKTRLEELNCRKEDIEARKNTELVSRETMLKKEVELWLAKVEKIKTGEFPSSLVIAVPKRGDPLPTTTIYGGSETTFKRKMEEIWESLMDDEVTKIGVYGMGGIGKTTALEHINNRILERKDKFDSVIWVTVSKDSDYLNLQDKIAEKLGVDISKDNDKITRAAKLQEKFETKKRFVIILDDLWEVYSLKEVGILEPTLQNGCKLVLTTRSLEICHRMGCKPIRIELLSDDEALDLFLNIVGRNVLSAQNWELTIKEIVKECAGLPLAVVIIAGSLKGTTDYNEWEIALEELREVTKGSTSDGIFERLKFSYDRLENKNLQDCLLYCALYPEDHEIERDFLIEHLIAEGIIEEKNTRHYDIKKGQVMLNKLVNVCLLNENKDENWVKMHDLVRDMALRITSESHRVLVKAGLRLKSIPGKEHWKYDVAKVSLIDNDISDIPPSIEPPKCPTLSTFLLSENRYLESISDTFFLHMKGLKILDLSYNSTLKKLPESVSDLVALTALFLRGCKSLSYVPSLAKLGELRKLDCSDTGIDEVPQGMEMLVKLKYLNFGQTSLKTLPEEISCTLTNLQFLSFNRHAPRGSTWLKLRGKHLEKMRKLETFEAELYDVNNFNTFVRCLEQQTLVSYVLQLGFIDDFWWTAVDEGGKVVYLTNYNISVSVEAGGDVPMLLLPKDVEFLGICDCRINVRNLCELTSFNNVNKLRGCYIGGCGKIEHVFSYSPSIFSLLQNLEELSLQRLQKLHGLTWRERGAESPLPPGTFSSLKKLWLIKCDKIKRLITISNDDDTPLPNLEGLFLGDCEQLKEIIFTISNDDINDDGDQNEEGRTDHHATNIISCPKLTTIELWNLPELQSIAVVADSLQDIELKRCPKLKRIPLLDGEPCPPSLQRVLIDEESWESLEWDHLNAKQVIQSLRKNDKW